MPDRAVVDVAPWNNPDLDEWRCERCGSMRFVRKAYRTSKVQCPECSPDSEGWLVFMHRLERL